MPWGGNQGRAIDDSAIALHLPRKPVKDIGIGLDFHAADMPVYNGYIDAARAMIEAKFIDYDRVGTRACTVQQRRMRSGANIAVS
ncbi:MAG: hypothetical protein C0429_08730 [Sphingopyxis sp.]|jgi:hypothetical protein|nr:hypothetical protein [Sphingopyxis sp.]